MVTASRARAAMALTLLALVPLALARAGDVEDRRVEFGTRIFRALMAADVDLPKKTVGNQLLVVFFYRDDAVRAREMAKGFSGSDVRGIAVTADVANDPLKLAARQPAAIFLSERPRKETLQALVHYGIDHRVIVYSPFEGDVESGILGGLSIEAQVRPFVNQSTLDASKITLKSIFMQVAKVYR